VQGSQLFFDEELEDFFEDEVLEVDAAAAGVALPLFLESEPIFAASNISSVSTSS
jgi:hypothetical protein